MKTFRIELRASPDTPTEESHARKNGKTLEAQTVFYDVVADTYEEACEHALAVERSFLYRTDVWVFGDREVVGGTR